MGHKIPKIQWGNQTLMGTTITNLILNFSSTEGLFPGMFVSGSGVPVGTIILSVDSPTQITLSNPVDINSIQLESGLGDILTEGGDRIITEGATSGVTLTFYGEIIFDYPPVEIKGELRSAKQNVSVALSGLRQVSTNYTEAVRKPVFSFLTELIKVAFEDFFDTWGSLGKSFRYFDDRLSVDYIEYEMDDGKFEPEKIASRGVSAYTWKVPFVMRRVV